ncbi:DedA family protein [Pseudarthrobacter sp. So.54]
MRKPKVQRALNWARYELDKRGAMLIFTARYIPVGRVAVNWIAGTTAYPRRRFVILDIIASITWVVYSAGVGIIAGNWVHDHPLLGVGIAIAFAIVLGIVIDHLLTWLHRWRDTRGATSSARPGRVPDGRSQEFPRRNRRTAASSRDSGPAPGSPQLAAPADVEA